MFKQLQCAIPCQTGLRQWSGIRMLSGSCQAVVWLVAGYTCQAVVRQSSGSYREVTRQTSRSCQAVIRQSQSSGTFWAVVSQSSGSLQAVIRQLSCSHQAVIRQSSRSHQADISLLYSTHSSFQRLTLTPKTLLRVWLSYCVHGKFSEYGFGLKHHFQSYCLMLGNSIRYSTRILKTTTLL